MRVPYCIYINEVSHYRLARWKESNEEEQRGSWDYVNKTKWQQRYMQRLLRKDKPNGVSAYISEGKDARHASRADEWEATAANDHTTHTRQKLMQRLPGVKKSPQVIQYMSLKEGIPVRREERRTESEILRGAELVMTTRQNDCSDLSSNYQQ